VSQKKQVAFLVPAELLQQVRQLSEKTRVTQAAYFREALEDLVTKYASALKPQKARARR
jgi:predicted DNA-binding protein